MHLTADTAISYVGGQFALSQAISHSFAHVSPKGKLANYDFEVLQPGLSIDSDNRIGPLVIPHLAPFSLQTLSLDFPELEIGQEISESVYRVWTERKRGFLFQPELFERIILKGIMLGEEGILSMEGGAAILMEDSKERILFFSTRKGVFFIEGVRPGEKYRLETFEKEKRIVEIEVPEGAKGIYQLKEVHFSPLESFEPIS